MEAYISTSLGSVVPNVAGAYMENPGYWGATESEPHNCGSCYCGTDTYNVFQYRDQGSHRVQSYKNDLIHTGTYPTGNTEGLVGYYATKTGTTISVYYIWTNNTSGINGTTDIYVNQGNSGYPYGAILLGTYDERILVKDVEKQPSTDPHDPDNLLPSGGNNAETDPFDETDTISDLDLFSDGWPFDPYATDGQGNLEVSMFTPYCLSAVQLQGLGKKLWSNTFLTNMSQFLAGRVDPNAVGVVSLFTLPIAYANGPHTGDPGFPVYLCGHEVTDGNAPAYGAHYTSRFKSHSLGSVTIKEVWGSAKDYTDVTINIFLPYVGMKSLEADHVINKKLSLYVIVDYWTGDLLYYLKCTNNASIVPTIFSPIGDQYYYQDNIPYRWAGNCAMDIPFSSASNAGVRNAISSAMTGLATSGAAAIINPALGLGGLLRTGAQAAGNIMGAANRGPEVSAKGGLSGSTGYGDMQEAFILITRPVPQYPNNWKEQFGAPRFQTFTVSDLAGYTEFFEIHADNVPGATDVEKTMIENQLKAGVIL